MAIRSSEVGHPTSMLLVISTSIKEYLVMKRLLKIGLGMSLGSITPILIWILLGLMHGKEMTNGMAYTYPYQFVFMLLASMLCKAQCKYATKEKCDIANYGRTGALMFLSISLIIAIVSLINIDVVGGYFGAASDIGKYAFAYGLLSMCIDWTAYYFADVYYYEEQDDKANKMMIEWYGTKVIYVLMTVIPYFNYERAVVFIVVTSTCQLLKIIVYNRPDKLMFNLKASVKYSLEDLAYNPFMALIYIFGIHDMNIQSAAILSAYNMVINCTDTQWDIVGAVDTDVTNEYCNGTYDKNICKIYKNVIGYSSILLISSILMLAVCHFLYPEVDMKYAIIQFVIEMVIFVPNAVSNVWTAWYAVAYPTPWIFIITLIKYVIRFSVQFIIASVYAVPLGVLIACSAGIVLKGSLYRYSRHKVAVRNNNEQ